MKRKIHILILCLSSLCFNCKVKAQETTESQIDFIADVLNDQYSFLTQDMMPILIGWNEETYIPFLNTSLSPFIDDYWNNLNSHLSFFENVPDYVTSIRDFVETIMENLVPNSEIIIEYLDTLNRLQFDQDDLLVHDRRTLQALTSLSEKIQQIVDNTSGSTGDGSGDTSGGSGNPDTGGDSGDGSNNCTCAEDLIEYYDGSFFPNFYEKFNSFSLSPQSYKFVSWVDLQSVDTDVEQETTTENITVSGDNFFAAITSYLDLLSRQQSVDNKSLVMIYKVLKGEDKSEEEQEIKNQVSQIQSQKDSLEGSFTFIEELGSTINFESYTDQIKIDGNGLNLRQIFGSGSLESSIYLGSFPSRFGDIDISGFNIDLDISGFLPYFEVARNCFSVVYWFLIATFIIFIFRKVYPLLYNLISFVSKVLPTK